VVTCCQRLITWMLLLAVLGQAAIPCACAQCGFAGSPCGVERLDQQNGRATCCHSHGDSGHDAVASCLTAHRHSRGQKAPCPAPSESPCRRLAVFVSADGSNFRTPLGAVYAAGTCAQFAAHDDTGPGCHATRITLDVGPCEASYLARSVRLQV
jgi:hypothetical protein